MSSPLVWTEAWNVAQKCATERSPGLQRQVKLAHAPPRKWYATPCRKVCGQAQPETSWTKVWDKQPSPPLKVTGCKHHVVKVADADLKVKKTIVKTTSVSVARAPAPSTKKTEAEKKRLRAIWANFIISHAANEAEVVKGCAQSEKLSQHVGAAFWGAPSTLARHLPGWRCWLQWCKVQNYNVGAPEISHFVDLIAILAGCDDEEELEHKVHPGSVIKR